MSGVLVPVSLQSVLVRIGGRASLQVQGALSEKCCRKTQIYQDLYPDLETQLENINLSHIVPPVEHTVKPDSIQRTPTVRWEDSNLEVEADAKEPTSEMKLGLEAFRHSCFAEIVTALDRPRLFCIRLGKPTKEMWSRAGLADRGGLAKSAFRSRSA